jgi:hypothetical protein
MPTGHRPPIPPGVARVAILGTTLGHLWTNIFYVQLSGSGIVAADLNTLASDIAGFWNTNFGAAVPSTVQITEVDIVYVPSVGNEVTGSWTGSHAGTSPNTQVADAAAAYVINWLISAYYRGGHPRMYLPGVTTNNVTNGSDIGASGAAALATDAIAFKDAINGVTTTNITAVAMGTLSFQTGNSWRTTPLFRPFTGAKGALKLGSQRRRIHS